MAYIAHCRGKQHKMKVKEEAPGFYKVRLDGQEYRVDYLEVEGGLASLIVGHHSYEVELDDSAGPELLSVGLDLERYEVRVREERAELLERRQPAAGSREEIRSPMAGNVAKVMVKSGARVEAGQLLFLLEAMKMQNEIRAPHAGRVGRVQAREGHPVALGALLCVLEG